MPPKKLTIKQREAARHEAEGRESREIATIVGVRPETLTRWRKQYLYRRHVDALLREADAQTIADVRKLRGAALKGVRASMIRALQRVSDPKESTNGIVRAGEFALKVYQTTASQTGIAMAQRIELTGEGGGPLEIETRIVEGMSDEELAAAEQVLVKLLEQAPRVIDVQADEDEEDDEEDG